MGGPKKCAMRNRAFVFETLMHLMFSFRVADLYMTTEWRRLVKKHFIYTNLTGTFDKWKFIVIRQAFKGE